MPTQQEIEAVIVLANAMQAAKEARDDGTVARDTALSAKNAARNSLDLALAQGANNATLAPLVEQVVATAADFLTKDAAIQGLWDDFNEVNGPYESALTNLISPV